MLPMGVLLGRGQLSSRLRCHIIFLGLHFGSIVHYLLILLVIAFGSVIHRVTETLALQKRSEHICFLLYFVAILYHSILSNLSA